MIKNLNLQLQEMSAVGLKPFSRLKNKPVKISKYDINGDQVMLELESKHGEKYPYTIQRDKIDEFLSDFIVESPSMTIQPSNIATIGGIRDMLCTTVQGVISESIDADKAKSIGTLAQTILNTLKLEHQLKR